MLGELEKLKGWFFPGQLGSRLQASQGHEERRVHGLGDQPRDIRCPGLHEYVNEEKDTALATLVKWAMFQAV